MHCINALHEHIFGPFGHDSDFITVDKSGALYKRNSKIPLIKTNHFPYYIF